MRTLFPVLFILTLSACIGDDIIDDSVPEVLRFTSCVDTLAEGTSFQLEAVYFDNIGMPVNKEVSWTTSDQLTIDINASGEITAVQEGKALISATIDDNENFLSVSKEIVVAQNTSVSETREGDIRTTSSYQLEGSFIARQEGMDLLLHFNEDFKASTALPGLYLYLTNNPTTSAGALEVKAVDVFSGEHEILVPNVDITTYRYLLYYCKPFSVKVGDGEMK